MPDEVRSDQIYLSTVVKWIISALALLTVTGGGFWMKVIADQISDTRVRIEKLENVIVSGADKNTSALSNLQIDMAVQKMRMDALERQLDRMAPDGPDISNSQQLKRKNSYQYFNSNEFRQELVKILNNKENVSELSTARAGRKSNMPKRSEWQEVRAGESLRWDLPRWKTSTERHPDETQP